MALSLYRALTPIVSSYPLHIHPVFHVSLLEPHVANTFPNRVVAPLLPIQMDGLLEFEIASILDSRFHRRKL